MEWEKILEAEKPEVDREILKLFIKGRGCTLTDDNRIIADDTEKEVGVLNKWSYTDNTLKADIQLREALYYVASELVITT